jgi:hypothetical protein
MESVASKSPKYCPYQTDIIRFFSKREAGTPKQSAKGNYSSEKC